MKPLFIAYHTGGRYERHAQELAETLHRHDLPYEIVEVSDAGMWVLNCAQKPTFISQMMEANPGRAVVYIDADARVRQTPTLLLNMPPEVDVGVTVIEQWHTREKEMLSGTLYLSGSQASVDLVSAWRRRCKTEPNVWDQRHLQAELSCWNHLNVLSLPESYTYIFDRGRLEPGEVVIEHLQASRERVL